MKSISSESESSGKLELNSISGRILTLPIIPNIWGSTNAGAETADPALQRQQATKPTALD